MVGGRAREQVTEAVREAAKQAGSLVTAVLALAAGALILALATLAYAIRTRRPA